MYLEGVFIGALQHVQSRLKKGPIAKIAACLLYHITCTCIAYNISAPLRHFTPQCTPPPTHSAARHAVGVAVFSRRALPLAAWTNGLDIAAVKADVDRSCLVLETGINQRWRYGSWRASPDSIEEAQNWEVSEVWGDCVCARGVWVGGWVGVGVVGGSSQMW